MNSPQQFKAAVVRIYFSTKKHVSERKILLTDMPKLLIRFPIACNAEVRTQ